MLSFSFTIAFVLHLLLFATAPMSTIIMTEMNLSYTEYGLIFSVSMISLIFFRIPWGIIGDRIGYLNALRIALPISAISAIIRAISNSYSTLLMSQFILGIGLAVVLPCLPILIKEWHPKTLGLSTGVYISGFAAGNAAALGLTPYLLEILNWRAILVIYSGIAVALSILWWCCAKSYERSLSHSNIRKFKVIINERYIWMLLLLVIASMGSYDTLATWLPKILEIKALDKAYSSFLPLGFFLAGPFFGGILDKYGKKRTIIALLGLISVTAIIGINYSPFPLLLHCIFFAGFAIIGVLTIILEIPTEHETLSPNVGSVVGLVSSFGNIGSLLIPVLFGFLIDKTSTYYFSIFTVAFIVGIVFILGSRQIE